MTDEELEAIRSAAMASTAGPIECHVKDCAGPSSGPIVRFVYDSKAEVRDADLDFWMEARTDVLSLLDEIARLKREVARLKGER